MGYSNEDVAKKLNLSSSTVATLYSRARSKGYQVVIIIPGDSMRLFDQKEEIEKEG